MKNERRIPERAGSFAAYELEAGFFLIEHNGRAVTGISRLTETPEDLGVPTRLTDSAASQLAEYFNGSRREFDFPRELRGTGFQLRVWEQLLRIPYGETRSYGEIAAAVGSPRAARAVGAACNRNPIAVAVPCHRVVGADGSLTGYAGGLDMKEALLRLEAGGR